MQRDEKDELASDLFTQNLIVIDARPLLRLVK